MDVLRNLVEYGDLLLVISGVEGVGKTTFLNQFLLTSDKRWNCCRLDARENMSIDSLVDGLLRSFDIKARGENAQSDEALLRAHLANIHANGEVAMIAVDDAHLLPQISTEFLLRLAEERGRIELRLLLTTEPGRLGFSTNDAKHVHVVVLQPFDLQQSGDYLHTRLNAAGLVCDSPFNASVVDDIHQDSGGLPGTIHTSALHTLLADTDISQVRSGLWTAMEDGDDHRDHGRRGGGGGHGSGRCPVASARCTDGTCGRRRSRGYRRSPGRRDEWRPASYGWRPGIEG